MDKSEKLLCQAFYVLADTLAVGSLLAVCFTPLPLHENQKPNYNMDGLNATSPPQDVPPGCACFGNVVAKSTLGHADTQTQQSSTSYHGHCCY